MTTTTEVRCGGCGTLLGITHSSRLSGTIYCADGICESEPKVDANEERNDIAVELFRLGLDQIAIAMELELTRQRVNQILQARGIVNGKAAA